jgi:hypothetical protein
MSLFLPALMPQVFIGTAIMLSIGAAPFILKKGECVSSKEGSEEGLCLGLIGFIRLLLHTFRSPAWTFQATTKNRFISVSLGKSPSYHESHSNGGHLRSPSYSVGTTLSRAWHFPCRADATRARPLLVGEA